eukprot:15745990-Heterocapsa_arctica.AAC.1
MLADKGELEPKLAITQKVLVNWLRQIEGGMSEETYERCNEYAVYTGIPRGLINYFRREIKDLGWTDNTPTNITDHNNIIRGISECPSFVRDGINRARQLAWGKTAKNKPNDDGVEKGVDEFTTRKI